LFCTYGYVYAFLQMYFISLIKCACFHKMLILLV